MKRCLLLVLLIAVVHLPGNTQTPDKETHRAIRKAIQKFAWSTPTPWMENYAWLQQQEMPWFNRDTFTMTWGMDPSNLLVIPDTRPGLAWTAVFDPIWSNGSHAPVPERFEWRGKTCHSIAGPDHFVEDIGFVFALDSSLNVLEALPVVDTRENGYLRRLAEEDLEDIDCSECIKVTYRGVEADNRYKVGQHHRMVNKMRQYILSNSDMINEILDRAVRETYSGFRILTIESCNQPQRACWYNGEGTSHTIKTYGKITAATGPKELQFEAVFRFPEGEDPLVEDVRIFK